MLEVNEPGDRLSFMFRLQVFYLTFMSGVGADVGVLTPEPPDKHFTICNRQTTGHFLQVTSGRFPACLWRQIQFI